MSTEQLCDCGNGLYELEEREGGKCRKCLGRPTFNFHNRFFDKLTDMIINWTPPFSLRVITKFLYPSIDKVDITVSYLFPGESVTMSDSEKIIAVITRKGSFLPYILVEFPDLTPDEKDENTIEAKEMK